MNLHRVYLTFLFLVCFTVSTVSIVSAEDAATVSTTAEGVGVIESGNKARARDDAIQDALRIAVEQAVGTMVASETLVKNYEVLRDRIYSKTQGYVQGYTIVDEKTEDSLFRVTVQATVKKGHLQDDLMAMGLLMERKNLPRVMLMVAEQNIGRHYYSFWWGLKTENADLTVTENTLMEQLSGKGFVVIDPATASGDIQISKPYRTESLSTEDVVTIGRLYDAEVVIYGKALAKLAGSVMNSSMKSAMADISLRAVNTDNARVIASATEHAAAVHPSEVTAGSKALKTAAESIADNLITQITARWNQEVSGGSLIRLEISGVTDYSQLVVFKEKVQAQIRGVSGMYQRSFEQGLAVMDLKASRRTQTLADEMVTIDYGDFRINVTGVSQNRIQLAFE
ncbi:MAG: hypothetical protein LJE94_12670 [Deltaproteobacteria bacterium]|nr:hypothetical protein [Deltaproteobacteria bacterium]